MNIISVDLNWAPGRPRIAVATANSQDRNITVEGSGYDDKAFLELVRESMGTEALILLDIPIEGCHNLVAPGNSPGRGDRHFRPVDLALMRQGIWLLPASKAGSRGSALKKRLEAIAEEKKTRTTVKEIYPYAVYKFLSWLEKRGKLDSIESGNLVRLLDDGFRRFCPNKYKRAHGQERREAMRYLHSLLNHPQLGLSFSRLAYPHSSSNLNLLADEYDACLGAAVGIYWAIDNPYAWVAGDSASGEVLLLADRWLKERLRP